jgi:integrase/recombinase XerC
MHQIDEKLEWLEEVRTKGRRFRNVYIPSAAKPLLESYLEARKHELKRFFPRLTEGASNRLPVFVSTHSAQSGDPDSFFMGAKSVWRAVRNCSVDTKLHPHLLRHTFATGLLDSSRDIRLVAQALGHSDVRITMRYTERTNEEVAEAIEKRGKKQPV